MHAVIGIVDDDASVLRALTRLLDGVGFTVKTFGSAEEFLALELPETIDCLLLDIHMSGLSGFDLQARLAEDQILSKPFDEHSLIGAIEKALGRE